MAFLSLVQSRTWYEKFNDSSVGNSTIRWRCSALMAGHRAFPSVVARTSLPFSSEKRAAGTRALPFFLLAIHFPLSRDASRVSLRGLSMFHASIREFARAWRSFAFTRGERKYSERMTDWFPNVSHLHQFLDEEITIKIRVTNVCCHFRFQWEKDIKIERWRLDQFLEGEIFIYCY